jgi:hypothetical protein
METIDKYSYTRQVSKPESTRNLSPKSDMLLKPSFQCYCFQHCEHISFYASNRLHITALENKRQTVVIILLFISKQNFWDCYLWLTAYKLRNAWPWFQCCCSHHLLLHHKASQAPILKCFMTPLIYFFSKEITQLEPCEWRYYSANSPQLRIMEISVLAVTYLSCTWQEFSSS